MSVNPYVDLHSHLQLSDFDEDRDLVIEEMRKNNVVSINIGVDEKSSVDGIVLAQKYPGVLWATVGLHPLYPEEIFDVEKFLEDDGLRDSVCGIGECGLDYFRILDNDGEQSSIKSLDQVKDFQKEIFINQIKASVKYNIPLMLHVRDSYGETLEILRENFKGIMKEYKGNVHFFAGNIEEAKAFLELGFSISFTGVITFIESYRELVEFVPLDRMFAETDSPYVSPKPFRGQRNNPNHVIEIYKKIAEIKNVDLQEVIDTLYGNAKRFWLK